MEPGRRHVAIDHALTPVVATFQGYRNDIVRNGPRFSETQITEQGSL